MGFAKMNLNFLTVSNKTKGKAKPWLKPQELLNCRCCYLQANYT